MPSTLKEHIEQIVGRLKTDVQAAWAPRKIFFGVPRTHQAQLPTAVIDLVGLTEDDEGSTVRQTAYRLRFSVSLLEKEAPQEEGRMRMVERADVLRSTLMTGALYAGGILPSLTSAELSTDEEHEAVDILTCDVAMTIVVDSLVA